MSKEEMIDKMLNKWIDWGIISSRETTVSSLQPVQLHLLKEKITALFHQC